MDTGKPVEDYTFYEGFEDEPEVTLYLGDRKAVHIWDGYFADILDGPPLDGKGWTGFTRDYQQCEGAFSDEPYSAPVHIDSKEYLEDLLQYREKAFQFEETAKVYETIVDILREAIGKGIPVSVSFF